MPNLLHLFTSFVYHLGLAVWIGGTVALGALVAPALFRSLPRPQAGSIFGPVLRRFARVRIPALLAVIGAAAVKYVLWEGEGNAWIAIRWASLAVMAATLLYEVAYLEPALERQRSRFLPEDSEQDPARKSFAMLHLRAERLMKLSFSAALVALLIS
jgi:hypothetical protein